MYEQVVSVEERGILDLTMAEIAQHEASFLVKLFVDLFYR